MPKTADRAPRPSIKDVLDLNAAIEKVAWLAAKYSHTDEPDMIGDFEEMRARIGEWNHDLQSECDKPGWDDLLLSLRGSLRIILERLEAR
jgi:hypothetical protein